MKLKDGMLLFHGSYTAVESIDLDRCMSLIMLIKNGFGLFLKTGESVWRRS
jgi:hypothetical protein